MAKLLKSLSDTYIFRLYDKTLHLKQTIIKLTKEGVILGDNEIFEYTSVFDRRYAFPMKTKMMEDYKAGRVLLLYNDKDYKLPSAVPSFLMNNGKRIMVCVNTSNYMTVNKNNVYTIDPKILFSLMQCGTLVALCFTKYNVIKNKTSLIKLGSSMYSRLFSKTMGKMFSLSITPAKMDVITYLSSLYFIYSVMGRDEETMQELNMRYAMDNCKSGSRLVIEDYVRKIIPEKDFLDLDTFITALATNVPGLEGLTTRSFIDQYIMAYGPNMMLGLEFLPYFYSNLGDVTVGSFLNNQHVIENILGTDINALFKELNSL